MVSLGFYELSILTVVLLLLFWFYFLSHLECAQGLLVALSSGIIPGGIRASYVLLGIEPRLTT